MGSVISFIRKPKRKRTETENSPVKRSLKYTNTIIISIQRSIIFFLFFFFLNFEEVRELPNPGINFSNARVGQSVTHNNTGPIPKTINRSSGRGRGFTRISTPTNPFSGTV